MPKYNFLPNNKSDFPHIGNVDTYKYDNDFDYGRFDAPQMELQICTVPWDMGEAHIGNRTISGIGNVVYFGSKENRDAWFDAIPDDECYRFTTKFKELHSEHVIDVPVPYDMCAKHNYLVVRYAKFANDGSPVEYEGNGGLREWFWFIREVEFVAPNTTKLHLLDDAFQTWIYDVNVSGMILERGHAPMFAMRADDYLENPIQNNEYLLTEDVNYGDASIVQHIDVLELNAGTMYACIATTANPTGTWGSEGAGTWNTPASSYYMNDGCPSVYVFAMQVANLNTFLANVDSQAPQFKQTIQAVFFASKDLVTLAGNFTFCNVTCYGVAAGRKTFNLSNIDKGDFAYNPRYADIAKLYTDPYAHIEVTDENGNTDIIRIEDTNGTIDVSAALSLAFPFINIDAHLMGVGGTATASVTFKNIYSHTFNVSGQWYDYLRSWAVPTFAVVQDSSVNYDFATDFDRKQRVVDYTTTQTNQNAIADTQSANATLTTTANTATVNRSNLSANTDANNTITINDAGKAAQKYIIDAQAKSTIAFQDQQGSIASASTVAGGAVGAIGAAASLDLGGTISSVANAVIGAETTQAQTQVAIGMTQAGADFTNASNSATTTLADDSTTYKVNNQTATASDLVSIQNSLVTGTTANTVATEKANATREATRAQSSIDNDIAQAALNAPYQFGSFSNGQSAATKPIAMFAHIVTQSKSAIASAGDEFLRYGYMLDRQWEFDGNWNIGKYFTYWKLKDFWVTNLNVPDMYMDKLRFFLFGGVTVWRNPDYIGKVTVYDNFN